MSSIAYVGMDVHKESITICILPASGETILDKVTLPNDEHKLCKYLAKWQSQHELRCFYEAGPGGYVVYRWLQRLQITCTVIAPSLIPKSPGNHVKTDARDAHVLAIQGRAGTLSAVHVPTPEQEAIRGIVRCREARLRDVQAARHRVLKFLAVRGVYYPSNGGHWTQGHRRWLSKLTFEGLDQWTYQEYLTELSHQESRLAEVNRQTVELASRPESEALLKALCCLRGIDTLTAVTLLAETLDFRRFPTAAGYMCFLGLTCSEDSTGQRRQQGRITRAGNGRCRRLLVEAAWHYRHKPVVSGRLIKRHAGQPAEVVEHAWKAQQHLHKLFWRLSQKKKDSRSAVVAVARELAGFIWAIAQMMNK